MSILLLNIYNIVRFHILPNFAPLSIHALQMLVELFLEGLCLAYETFQMNGIETRISGLEHSVNVIREQTARLSTELESIKDAVDRQANFRIASLRDESMKLLGGMGCANALNADVLSYFVASMGSHITAITFRGRRRYRPACAFGMQVYRGFMAGTHAPERIFQTLRKMQELSELTGGRIVTGCATNNPDMKAVAVAIAAFFKVARLLGVRTCPITDETGDPSAMEIVIRFEGSYSMSRYENILSERTDRIEVIRSNRKNVYILGPNGVGKSTWGNFISGAETFEVGISDHTTMIPQSCDIGSSFGFRLWDTPGLFDGSEQQGLMEDYMNHVIDVNGYCSGVLFVFSGSVPSSEATAKVLRYAVDRLGEHVKNNFVAIVNDFDGRGRYRMPTYGEFLYQHGFIANSSNFFVSNAKVFPNPDCHKIRNRLSEFRPKLVSKHSDTYKSVIQAHGDLNRAVRNLYLHGRQELEGLLRRGKIETIRYQATGPRKNTSLPRDVIYFRQHSKGFLLRRLGIVKDRILEERSVKLKGSTYFITLIRAQMNQEYSFGEVNLFLRHVLEKDRYILIHTPNGECDYELRDGTNMTNFELQELVFSHLVHQIK